jgi:hypothetical protein
MLARAALVLAAAMACTLPALPASACGNAYILATDANVRAVKDAEAKLNDGKPAEAAKLIAKKAKNIDKPWVYVNTKDPGPRALLLNRSIRIYALATVRLGGTLGPNGKGARSSVQRKENIDWATSLLKSLFEAKPGDAAAKTDYGEALARTDAAAAKPLLEDLATRDVLATPYAYAALASLRDAAGDGEGRDAATARCRLMAVDKAVCEARKPSGSPAWNADGVTPRSLRREADR